MSEKPEWFQLTGDDETPKQPITKSKKRFLKVALFTAPLLLIGGAMVFADGHDEEERPNIDTTISSATTSTSSNSTSATQSSSKAKTNESSVTKVATAPAKSITAPAAAPKGVGVPAPSAKGDDDREGFEGDREHREGGERDHHDRDRDGRNGPAPKIPQSGTSAKN